MWWRKKKQIGNPMLVFQEAVAFQQHGRFGEARKKLEELAHALRKEKDKRLLAAVLSQLSQVYLRLGDIKQATKCVGKSAAIRTELRDFQGLSIDYQMIGTMLMNADKLDEAHGYFSDSLGLATSVGDETLIATAESNLGLVALLRGDHSEAESHLQKSQSIRKKQGDKLGVAKNLNHLGQISEAKGRFEEATSRYEESLSLLRVLGAPEATIALHNLDRVKTRK